MGFTLLSISPGLKALLSVFDAFNCTSQPYLSLWKISLSPDPRSSVHCSRIETFLLKGGCVKRIGLQIRFLHGGKFIWDTQKENNLKKTKDSDSHYLCYHLRLDSKLNGTLTFKYVFNCVINLLLSLILGLVHI